MHHAAWDAGAGGAMDGLVGHFRAMARNNAWANRRLLTACVALGPREFAAPRVSFFPSLRETLNHNLLIDRYYLDALEEGGGAGRSPRIGPTSRARPPCAPPRACRIAG